MRRSECITQYHEAIESQMAWVRAHIAGLSEAQFNWKRNMTTWSPGQCLQHINMVGRHWVKRLDRLVREAEPAQGDADYQPGRTGIRVLRRYDKVQLSKPRVRAKFAPHFNVYTVGCLNEFFESRQRLAAFAGDLANCDLAANKVGLPSFPMIRIRLGDGLALVNRHAAFFLTYAEQVLALPGFPNK